MKRLAIILAAVGALAMAGAAPRPALAQSPASAQPDPVRLDLARRLQELAGGRAQADAQMKAMFGAMQKGLAKAMPPEQSRLTAQIYDDLLQQMIDLMPRILDLSALVWAENYTEKELRDLLAFQMSDSGRSIAHKSLIVHAQVMAEMMPLVVAMLPEMMRKTTERVCQEARCSPEQRQMVASALATALKSPAS